MIKRILFTNLSVILFAFLYSVLLTTPVQAVQSKCVIVNINILGLPTNLPPNCESTGEMPSADRVLLLTKIKTYVEQDKISFAQTNDRTGMTNGTGVVKRMDGSDITIDTQLLRLYVYMVDQGYTFQVSSMIGSHSKFSSSGNVSRHWDGHAADISIINNSVINQTTSKTNVVKFMKTLNALSGNNIVPRQVLCAGAGRNDPSVDALSMNGGTISPGFTAKYVGNHIDHVHIGY